MNKNKFEIGLSYLNKHDKVLSRISKNYSNRNLTPHRKYFNLLLGAIVGQQLSVKAARSIKNRVFNHFNDLPTPEAILDTPHQVLRGFGMSNAKVTYAKDLSSKIITGEVKLKGFAKMTDDEIISELTKVKGIGVWSVHMFLIFNLARLNVLPVGDLGIKKAIMLNYGLRKLPTEEKVRQIAKKNNWEPYCSIASLLLWHSIDNKM